MDALVLLGSFFVLMMIGVPVAYALGMASLIIGDRRARYVGFAVLLLSIIQLRALRALRNVPQDAQTDPEVQRLLLLSVSGVAAGLQNTG